MFSENRSTASTVTADVILLIRPAVLTRRMSYARRSRSACATAGLATILLSLGAPAHAKDCPKGDAPARTRPAQETGSGTALPAPPRPDDRAALKAGERPGFIDLGNGTEVRVGGRVRLDVDHSR